MTSSAKCRPFLELSNNEITLEWVAKKYNELGVELHSFERISQSIVEVQKELRMALDFLDQGGIVTETIFPLLFAFKDETFSCISEQFLPQDKNGRPIRHATSDNKISDELTRRGVPSGRRYSIIATEAAKDFLDFLENELQKLRRCPFCDDFFLPPRRSDQVYCDEACKDRFHTQKVVASGKAAKRQKRFRDRRRRLPEIVSLPEDRILLKAAEGHGARDSNCQYYAECLDVAAKKNWPDFTCERCPQKQ